MLISFDQKEYQKLNDKSYQLEKRSLQIELLQLQEDVIRNKRRICIVFEGRDTAGKSSAFKFFAQYLIPKNFKYVNLGIPTKWESSHWFQRWKKVVPKKYSNFLFILVMGVSMSLIMTLIITYINTGMDSGYVNRFLKAWVVGLPIAIAAAFIVGPAAKKFVDKITK